MIDYKIDLSILTIGDYAILGSPIAYINPFVALSILDKCVNGGILNRPVSELDEIMKQIGIEVALRFSAPLGEVGDIVQKGFEDDKGH